MSASFISTSSLTSTLRIAAMQNQVQLAKATKESTTGRFADPGLSLGALTGRDVSLRAEIDRVDKTIDTNQVVSGRLDSSQAAMDSLVKTAQDFVQQLITVRDSANGASSVLPTAKTNLDSLVSTLDTTLYGQYLFGGINTDVAPALPYTATSSSKAAVDAAFLAEFGMSQSSVTVNTISPAAMQTFLTGNFANLFAGTNWSTDWSTASDTTITSRISTTQVVQASASANQTGIKQLAQVYTMMSDLGAVNMSQAAFQTVVDRAVELTTAAIADIVDVQGKLGTSQQMTTNATDSLNIQKDLLTKQVDGLEAVDPTESSVRVTALQNQYETALALISKIQNLSILNFM
jgi:flagellar hook-associated protein 3 FlgL